MNHLHLCLSLLLINLAWSKDYCFIDYPTVKGKKQLHTNNLLPQCTVQLQMKPGNRILNFIGHIDFLIGIKWIKAHYLCGDKYI